MVRPSTSRSLIGLLGRQDRKPSSGQEGTGVANTWNKNGRLVRTLSCRHACVGHLGAFSGAMWHVTQRPGHVARHAPIGWLGRDSGFGQVRIHGCGLDWPTWLTWGTGPATTAAYVNPPSGGPSCRLPGAACSPVTEVNAGRGAERVPGAGRLLAGSVMPPEPTSSLALRLPTFRLGVRSVVLRVPADPSVLFFLLEARAVLSTFSAVGETCSVERALKKLARPAFAWCSGRKPAWKKGMFQ
jgi:hypothetical protein